jgi:hypothetical protein
MRRLRYVLLGAFLFLPCTFVGCGEDQPNAPAKPAEVNADFGKKSMDMMKATNTGMDPKASKKAGAPAK